MSFFDKLKFWHPKGVPTKVEPKVESKPDAQPGREVDPHAFQALQALVGQVIEVEIIDLNNGGFRCQTWLYGQTFGGFIPRSLSTFSKLPDREYPKLIGSTVKVILQTVDVDNFIGDRRQYLNNLQPSVLAQMESGQQYPGTIINATSFDVFVEIAHCMVGRLPNVGLKTCQIGDPIQVYYYGKDDQGRLKIAYLPLCPVGEVFTGEIIEDNTYYKVDIGDNIIFAKKLAYALPFAVGDKVQVRTTYHHSSRNYGELVIPVQEDAHFMAEILAVDDKKITILRPDNQQKYVVWMKTLAGYLDLIPTYVTVGRTLKFEFKYHPQYSVCTVDKAVTKYWSKIMKLDPETSYYSSDFYAVGDQWVVCFQGNLSGFVRAEDTDPHVLQLGPPCEFQFIERIGDALYLKPSALTLEERKAKLQLELFKGTPANKYKGQVVASLDDCYIVSFRGLNGVLPFAYAMKKLQVEEKITVVVTDIKGSNIQLKAVL